MTEVTKTNHSFYMRQADYEKIAELAKRMGIPQWKIIEDAVKLLIEEMEPENEKVTTA